MADATPDADRDRQYLMNITRAGRHVGLLSTHNRELVTILEIALKDAGYATHTDCEPSPLARKKR
jgi:hypothetical protein